MRTNKENTKMDKISDYSFCVHPPDIWEEWEGWNVITFCPVEYWKQSECLPDFYFNDKLEEAVKEIPEDFKWLVCKEECQWISTLPIDEIINRLTALGFSENKEMEKFLIQCMT